VRTLFYNSPRAATGKFFAGVFFQLLYDWWGFRHNQNAIEPNGSMAFWDYFLLQQLFLLQEQLLGQPMHFWPLFFALYT
jgi:hypothetical protein